MEIVENIGRFMLKTKRQFIIEHKAVFETAIIEAAIIAFARILPEPTLTNTGWVNTPILLRIRDKFLSYHHNRSKKGLFWAAWTVLIDIPEHDPYYRTLLQWLLEELVESVMDGEWQPRSQNDMPEKYWSEPRPKGNFNGRRFKEFIKALIKDGE